MRHRKKQTTQDRRNSDTLAQLKEWTEAKTPLRLVRGNYCFVLRPVEGDAGISSATIRMRGGKVSITVTPRPRATKSPEVLVRTNFSNLMEKE